MFSYWFKSPLLIATEENDLAKLKNILEDATPETINCTYSVDQITALTAACSAGHSEIVLALLAHPDIDVNSKKKYALYFAAEKGYCDIVETLLACPDIDVNFVGMWGRTPLNNAAKFAHSDVVQLLLTRPDIDINADDHTSCGPLVGLLVNDYDIPRSPVLPAKMLATAQLLLKHPSIKIDLIYRTQEGDTEEERPVDDDADVEAGANASATNKAALHNRLLAAVIAGDMIAVESLLAQPEINVNVLGVMDRMALHWAAFFGHTEIVRVLLAQPNIELNGFDTVSILIYPVSTLIALQRFFVHSPFCVVASIKDGRTPLALAARHGNAEAVKVLLDAPGVVVNSDAMSTLHAVLIQRDGEFDESDTPVSDLVATLNVLLVHPTIDLSLLVDSNYAASIIPDHAQFLAGVLCGDTEKVNTFLARADTNVNILSIDNHTALSWASYLGHTEIVQALLSHPLMDLQLNKKTGQLRAALEWAIRYDHTDVVKALLTVLDQPDNEDASNAMFGDHALLNDAVALGRVDIVRLFVARSDVDLGEGRPNPERKRCEDLVKEARAVRLAQRGGKAETNKDKRRSWWEAFGLV
eukprot:gene11927-13834_t